ncbi:hypothetical protein NQ318_011794 [Aromia moschata]|uniref:Acyltransferase n=1 Tax=Aromia moschata TaxID=1265417 RepID=A0AAV8Y7G3_9CUCU|nr:hypothetical protein NQ318_011794 [Aromia moschata]
MNLKLIIGTFRKVNYNFQFLIVYNKIRRLTDINMLLCGSTNHSSNIHTLFSEITDRYKCYGANEQHLNKGVPGAMPQKGQMAFLGIKFAPLTTPIKSHLRALAAVTWLISMTFGGVIGAFIGLYLILYTRFWWIMLLYLFWMWVIDKDVAERGGRRSRWAKSWTWWKYLNEYFPLKLVKLSGVELDPSKNYLMCCFPHGMLPSGVFNAFVYEHSGYNSYFPNHTNYLATLAPQFILPFGRELILEPRRRFRLRQYILSKPGGGNACIVVVGGAKEAYYCKPGSYTLILKERKGFVRLALRQGAPLVPVFSFGETDLYDQLDWPPLRWFQEKLRKWIALAPVVPIGRGFFQYSFGLIPRNRPVTTVECALDWLKLDDFPV